MRYTLWAILSCISRAVTFFWLTHLLYKPLADDWEIAAERRAVSFWGTSSIRYCATRYMFSDILLTGISRTAVLTLRWWFPICKNRLLLHSLRMLGCSTSYLVLYWSQEQEGKQLFPLRLEKTDFVRIGFHLLCLNFEALLWPFPLVNSIFGFLIWWYTTSCSRHKTVALIDLFYTLLVDEKHST